MMRSNSTQVGGKLYECLSHPHLLISTQKEKRWLRRAGWFPADTDLDQDLSKRYKWISGMSITGMEILHGALLGLNPNAAFCLRQPDFLSMLPPAFEKDFRDADNWSIEFLQALKDQIHQKFPPQQIFKYQCTVSGLEESSGISKVQLSGLEPLCSWVLEFLKNAIQRMFPDHTETLENRKSSLPSWYRSQLHQHSLFSVQKSRLVLGRDREVADVLKYLQLGVTEHQEDMSMHESPEDPESNKPGRHSSTRIPPYLMVAPPGTGKSCLMAQCVFEAQKIPSFSLFFHFVGCCPASTELTNLVARLCCHLTPEEADQKDLLEKLKEADGISALKSILRDRLDDPVNLKRPLVICIDAFNQIYPSQDAEELLTWLQDSSFFPGNCRCVITTASLTPALTLVTTLVHEVNPLSLESARELATTYLSRYNKRLSSRQLELLLSKRSSLSPLWMTLACEELRLFGVFERVTHLIQSFPDSLEGILGSILCRLVGEDDSGLLKDFVCILHCSRDGGVLAIDVQGVLGLKRGGQAISSMEWAQLQRSVKELLRISYDWKGRDIVTFFHSSVAQAVGSCFFGRQEDKINYMCLLADYYENNCPDAATVTSELVWLLNEAGLHSRLVSFLRNDQRALSISCHTRFSYIRKLRCSWHCQPGSQTKRALLCSSCSVRTRAFGQLFLNSQSCAICGQVARMKPQEAYLCIQHSRFGPPECLVCKKIILPQPPPLPAVLCHMCGFTPRCVALNV
ncbi:telomerase protein component 1-like isoform X2 [Polypterus senegalus]|uniref:telomerase protein component 1-like isoform X2 n=1 Tax=Polypterus senegalus TaxID=55291 RepID=UPI0019634210|nr:telomerase protein component 1-like isoform X2 [Polypterus senegalus]